MAARTRRPFWLVEPLAKKHDRAAFSCGNETLDRYLKEIATQDARRLVAAPFVAVAASAPKTILGYYTLSSFTVALSELRPSIVPIQARDSANFFSLMRSIALTCNPRRS